MKNIIKKISVVIVLAFTSNLLFAWAETGHRVVGEVAFKNIKPKTLKKINQLINYQSIAEISTFGDDIKSDAKYKKFFSWHFVNFEEGKKYEECKHNPEGDLIQAIDFCMKTVKDKNASKEDRAFYLKMLVHFVGDLHQPLHVGREADKGGNDISVKWFGQTSNLHRVWDGDMIDKYNMSYTELANTLPHLEKHEIEKIKKGTVLDWVYESQKLANTVYISAKPEDQLSYRYSYEHFATVENQLQKAGYRLAKILDDIFS